MANGWGFFARHEALRSLAYRDYRLLLLGSTFVWLVMPLQFLTQIFWVQEKFADHDVLFVGLIAASRGSAMLVFSLLGGAIADRFERRRVLLACESASFGINALIALLMIVNPFGGLTMFPLLLLTFFAAGNMAIDISARTASTPAIVGMRDLSNAISLTMVAQQLTFPLMLPLTGLLNDLFEPGHVYAGSLAAWVFVIPLISALRFRDVGKADRSQSVFGNIREGLAYTRRDAVIGGTITLVIVVQLLGMPGVATLGPVWMTDVLGLSKREFGLIASLWGLGALAGSLFFAHRQWLTGRGITLCALSILFSVGVIVFGHSRIIPVTAAANFALGFAMVGSMVCASNIVQHTVSDEMRGRVMGLFPLAMGLSMLNAGPVSAAGQLVGLPWVVPTLGWITLALVLVVIVRVPALRATGRVGRSPSIPPEPPSWVPAPTPGSNDSTDSAATSRGLVRPIPLNPCWLERELPNITTWQPSGHGG